MLARFSAVVEALSEHLLRRRVVIPVAVLFVFAFPLGGNLNWLGDIGRVAGLLLFLLWLARHYVRRVGGPGAGLP
jgi:hypothetical protein